MDMLILAIETSGKDGGAALARGDSDQFELLGEAVIGAGHYSAELMPRIVALLENSGISKQQIEGFAVATGPGSFTGLRVGIATVKGLADTLGRPVAGVSVLEVIATSARDCWLQLANADHRAGKRPLEREHVVALLDAGRGEVYAGIYETGLAAAGKMALKREFITKLKELQPNLAEFAAEPWMIATSDDKLASTLQDQDIRVTVVPRPGARDIARQGLRKLSRGETVAVAELDANYIRRSDAEIFSLPKLQC